MPAHTQIGLAAEPRPSIPRDDSKEDIPLAKEDIKAMDINSRQETVEDHVLVRVESKRDLRKTDSRGLQQVATDKPPIELPVIPEEPDKPQSKYELKQILQEEEKQESEEEREHEE